MQTNNEIEANMNTDEMENVNEQPKIDSTSRVLPPTRQSITGTTQSPPTVAAVSQIYWFYYPPSEPGAEPSAQRVIAVNRSRPTYLPIASATATTNILHSFSMHNQTRHGCPYHCTHSPLTPHLKLIHVKQPTTSRPQEPVVTEESVQNPIPALPPLQRKPSHIALLESNPQPSEEPTQEEGERLVRAFFVKVPIVERGGQEYYVLPGSSSQ